VSEKEPIVRTCIYCGIEKPEDEFSDEHIWPDALGGNHLGSLWRTNDVCAKCNSISGVFIDGAFIRSWFGNAERATGAREYLSLQTPETSVLPLDYLGALPDLKTRTGEIAEFWAGPCGANIVHIRPESEDELWKTYSGGDPRARGAKAGRAYIALTSHEVFWILVSLASFNDHFKRAHRFIVNMDVPLKWNGILKRPDMSDPVQAADMAVVAAVTSAGQNGQEIRTRQITRSDVGTRFLAKLALAIGFKLLGEAFLATDYATNLRKGFREADPDKRKAIPVQGTGFLSDHGLNGAEKALQWPGAWVLLIKVTDEILSLSVVSPSGRAMNVVVCQEAELVSVLGEEYRDGLVWVTVPSLGEGVGPTPLPAYLAHQLGKASPPQLQLLSSKRIDPAILPPC